MPTFRPRRSSPSVAERVGAWLDCLASFNPAEARLLKADDLSRVWQATLLDTPVVIKATIVQGPINRIRSWMGRSRSFRQWEGAQLLSRAGVPTAEPLLLASSSPPACEWLVLRAIEGPTVLETLAQRPSADRLDRLATALGTQIRSMTHPTDGSPPIFNRDHKPSNLILDPTGDGTPTIVDTVGVRLLGRARPDIAAARMVASLIFEPTGVGHPPSQPFVSRLVGAAAGGDPRRAAALARLTSALVRAHGDPTPKVNPLNKPPR